MLKHLFTLFVALLLTACATIPSNNDSISFKPTYQAQQLWSRNIGQGNENITMAYAKQTIFAVNKNGVVTALNANNGKTLWQNNLGVSIATGISGNSQYLTVVSQQGQLFVLNSKNGKVLWQTSLSDVAWAAPLVYKNYVIVKTIDGNLTAYHAATGKPIWQYSNGTPSVILQGSSRPAASGNRIIAGFADGHLIAFHLKNGYIIWNKELAFSYGSTLVQRLVDIDDAPIIQDGMVYAASYQGHIAALNLKSGRYFWHHRLSSDSGLAVNASQVFATDVNGVVWAYDSDSGGIDWRQIDLRGHDLSAPATMGNLVAVGDQQGNLYWLNASDGAFAAEASVSGAINQAPIVYKNNLYVLTTNGYIAAYQLKKIKNVPRQTTKK